MKVKQHYESPQAVGFSFKSEGVLCTSDLLETADPLQEMEVETFEW